MTSLQPIDLVCPVCDNHFRSQSVVSTNSFGGKRTDFHERALSCRGTGGGMGRRAPATDYLVGELLRRVGDSQQAAEWLLRVESEIVDPDDQGWVREVARQQRESPREWFG